MTTRRDFMSGASAFAGAAFVSCGMLDHAHAQGARPRRREVMVAGKRVKTIDVHAHCHFHEALALIGWLVSMMTRQAGHFFFEPHTYDHINQATHEYKEEIKVGYNLQRKVVLMSIWALSPLYLLFDPTVFGLLEPYNGVAEFIRSTAKIWLALGLGGLLFRTIHLFFIYDVQTGLVWMTKILTDPFHDIMLYHKAPLALLRGELIDPGIGKHDRDEEEEELLAETEPRGA